MREREWQSDCSPHCLDCQVPLSPSCVTRTPVSGQRAKEEGGGGRESAGLSVLLYYRVQQSQRQSDSQTRRHQSPLHGVWPESKGGGERELAGLSVLLHCRAQQGQRQSDSQTGRHQSPLPSVWPDRQRRRKPGEESVCRVQVLLHCLEAGREGDPEHAKLRASSHIDHLHSALYIPVAQSPLG